MRLIVYNVAFRGIHYLYIVYIEVYIAVLYIEIKIKNLIFYHLY